MWISELLRAVVLVLIGIVAFAATLLYPTAGEPIPEVTQEAPAPESAPQKEEVVIPSLEEEPEPEAAPAKTTEEPKKPAPTPQTPVQKTEPAPAIKPLEEPQTFANVNERVRAALVNILCTVGGPGSLNSISASGVVIDPRGIIMTNAHVAQYFLLKDYPAPNSISCVARGGSPAYPKYTLELMYISPSWIFENAQKLDDETPTGTGQFDFALVRVTGSAAQGFSVPDSIPYVELDYGDPVVGQSMFIGGYPAGFLGGITIAKELYLTSSISSVTRVYTFDTGTTDLMSLGGTIVAQKGVSGGAVTNSDGKLIGVAVTATDAATTAERDLRAITIGHIDRTLTTERGTGLASLLAANPLFAAQTFQITTAPTLTKLLTEVLEN